MPVLGRLRGQQAFIQSFTESLQGEVEGSGVYVAAVCPGVTRTPFFESSGMDFSKVIPTAQDPHDVVAEAMDGIENVAR